MSRIIPVLGICCAAVLLGAATCPAAPAEGPEPARAQEPTPAPDGAGAQFVVDPAKARQGRSVFTQRGCNVCHTIGRGRGAGPDLLGVTDRREIEWVTRFITDPAPMLESDPIAIELLAEWRGVKMPTIRLTEAQVQALVHYLADETNKAREK